MKNSITASAIVGLALAGAALLGILAGTDFGGKVGATLFLCFLAVIVAFQVAPAVVLVGALLKEIFRPSSSKKEETRVQAGEGR